jgi:glycosyltransferase involved in cell wall biosynthesis/GT2 family glycosyltransferase
MSPRVSVTIVTWNSARFIRRCLDTIAGQTYGDLEVVVVDNGSQDATRAQLRESSVPSQVYFNADNRGFAAAQNQALAKSSGDVVLVLNPDTLLTPSFLDEALRGFAAHTRVGMVAPKLLRTTDAFEIPSADEARIDSAGMFLTSSLRHFDRGAGERDGGQYDRMERVFGPSGAAALYSRTFVEDVKVGGQFFDELFFAYREDADLAWRGRLFAWECVYIPRSVAYHMRRVRPELGRHVPADINRHSVKNRFLMRIKNATPDVYAWVLVPTTIRDLMVVAGAAVLERQSLVGLAFVVRHLRKVLAARSEIQRRRRRTTVPLRRWVGRRSMPLRDADADESDESRRAMRPRVLAKPALAGMYFGIDAHSAEREGEGNATYMRGLLSALLATHEDASFALFGDNPYHPFYRSLPRRDRRPVVRVTQGRGLVRLGWALGRAASRTQVDGLHTQYTAPLGYRGALVVTVHDLGFLRVPESFPPALRLALKVLVPRALARASRIITDSEFARRDIVERYGVRPDHIAVIPLGVDTRFHPRTNDQTAPVLARYGLEPGFLFSLGRLNRRKNLERLLLAYAQLRSRTASTGPLVIGGKADYGVEEVLHRAKLSDDASGIRLVGLIPEDDLPAFYSGAAGFIYPSLFEGFGLPVLEAMASGTPVVTSNRAALPELTADAALAVDPENVEALAEALTQITTDKDLVADLRLRGLERSRGFSWAETARRTLSVYSDALRAGRRG